MQNQYKFVEKLSEGLISLSNPVYGNQLWTSCTIKKDKECVISKVPLKGKVAYRPLTNAGNRMDRISTEEVNKLVMEATVSLIKAKGI